MSPSSPITMCQNINLTVGKTYSISYDLFCSFTLKNMLMSLTINGQVRSTLFVANEGQFGSNSFSMVASQNSNKFCFSEIHETVLFGAIVVGGLLDNVSVI